MLMKCPECGGTVSDKASACPHCGAPVEPSVVAPASRSSRRSACSECGRPLREPDSPSGEDEEECSLPPPRKGFDFAALFLRVMKFCFLLLTILILAGALFFFVLRYDLGGAATRLRAIAESDAGDGSHIDTSNSRVLFKYRLGAFLDSVQGKEKKAESPAPGTSVENARQLPDAESGEALPDKLPTDKVERSPIELPPSPPGENGEPEKKPSESPSAPEGPASIGEPPQEPGEGKIGGKEIN